MSARCFSIVLVEKNYYQYTPVTNPDYKKNYFEQPDEWYFANIRDLKELEVNSKARKLIQKEVDATPEYNEYYWEFVDNLSTGCSNEDPDVMESGFHHPNDILRTLHKIIEVVGEQNEKFMKLISICELAQQKNLLIKTRYYSDH
jgi:hypothetical protein